MDVTSIAEQLLFTTVRIETFDSENRPCAVGTGFFFSYVVGTSEKTITDFIVTNTHVVKSGEKGRLSFLLSDKDGKPKWGERFILDFRKEDWEAWYCNKDENLDVAILPFGDLYLSFAIDGKLIFRRHITTDLIPKEEYLKEIDAIEDIVFIGYPYGLWDEKNCLPIFRKGITASPITIDFEGQKKFLIDASVFPGSSGSPVFLFNQGSFNPKSGGLKLGMRLLFLGILSDVFEREVEGKIEYHTEKIKYHSKENEKIIPVPITNRLLNIGVVFKSSIITSTIEEFFPQYQKWREKYLVQEKKEA
jgi:hypothetical protein